MKCILCNKEFKAKRATAKYCSEACKKRYLRGIVRGTGDAIIRGTKDRGTEINVL